MFEKMRVTLSGSSDELTLSYRIRPHLAAQTWAAALDLASRKSELREKERFYHFPGDERFSLNHVVDRLKTVITRLKELHPDLEFPPLAPENLQLSVNTLHYHFAHSHHVTQLVNDDNREVWSEFNVLLHTLESCLTGPKIREMTGLPPARVVFTWNDSYRVPIPENAYDQFCLDYTFGYAYANYSQVGRQIPEMFNAGDDFLADEHIQPPRFLSADTILWFGPSYGHLWQIERLQKIQKWFQEREDRFHRLGLHWGDPKLALGRIPVAQLEQDIFTTADILKFVRNLGKFLEVSKVEVL